MKQYARQNWHAPRWIFWSIGIYVLFIRDLLPSPGDMRFSADNDTSYAERSDVSLMSCVQYLSGSLWFMLTVNMLAYLAYLKDGAS